MKASNDARKLTHVRTELYIPKAQYKIFERLARQEKISVNKFILRDITQKHLDGGGYYLPQKLLEGIHKLDLLIRNIANNINQIAHSSNIFSDAQRGDVLKYLQELNHLIHGFVDTNYRQ